MRLHLLRIDATLALLLAAFAAASSSSLQILVLIAASVLLTSARWIGRGPVGVREFVRGSYLTIMMCAGGGLTSMLLIRALHAAQPVAATALCLLAAFVFLTMARLVGGMAPRLFPRKARAS